MPPIVVVGAGAGGLSAAVALAAAGHAVTVVEAGPRVGGKLNVATADGVTFDTGPSVLTLPHLLDGVFRLAGTRLDDELTLRALDPGFCYRYPDGVALDVFHDPAQTSASIRDTLGADAALEFDAFLAYARRIWDAASPWFVTGAAPSVGTLWRAGPRLPWLLPAIDPLSSFADIFDRERPPAAPTVYLCAQSRAHGRTGWDDAEPLFVMANAPPEPIDGATPLPVWTDLRAVVHRRLVDSGRVHPDDPVVWERTPTQLAATYPRTRGSLYGAASNDRFAAFARPPNRWSRVRGLYLASGSAHPGGGVPLCVQSGRLAAEALIADGR